jgi:hypothetical protein
MAASRPGRVRGCVLVRDESQQPIFPHVVEVGTKMPS